LSQAANYFFMTKSRWEHKCPACKKTLHWRRLYCKQCIEAYPRRGNFLLSHKQRWLKKAKLHGVSASRNGLFILLNDQVTCVECGYRAADKSNLVHRCAYRDMRHSSHSGLVSCISCKHKFPRSIFPVIRDENGLVRLRACAGCLKGKTIVSVI
jgi:NAD-dependent dihydropyrimidine dehydrogenase PreA subunit